METAPSSLVWNHETLEQLKPQGDFAKAFHLLGKAHLLPTLRDPDPVMVWNGSERMAKELRYAHHVCCTFDTVAGQQNVWMHCTAFIPFLLAAMQGDEPAADAKWAEIHQRAEAGEFPVDTNPMMPTRRAVQLPPLNPQPTGVRVPSPAVVTNLRAILPALRIHACLAPMSDLCRRVRVYVVRVRNRTRLSTR
jgi:hypothetical protein